MGAEEVRPVWRRVSAVAAATLLALGALAGCGSDDEDENVSEVETLGPASAEGDIVQSEATLRSQQGFTTLVTTQVTTRGARDTLLAGQVALPGSSTPRLRLTVDGQTERNAEVELTGGGTERTAVISCACKLPTGEHEVVLEGAARNGSATVGARTLVIFPDVALEAGANPIGASDLTSEEAVVPAEGETLAESSAGDGSGPAIVLVTVASPRSLTGADNVRLTVRIGGDVADELAATALPKGKINAYLDENGAGKPVEVTGFTTSGHARVGATSIIVCDCDLAR